MKIQKLLNTEKRWCRGAEARDIHGTPVSPQSPEAVQWCLLGAINKCYGSYTNDYDKIFDRLRNTIEAPRKIFGVANFNDRASTTFADIQKLIEKADV